MGIKPRTNFHSYVSHEYVESQRTPTYPPPLQGEEELAAYAVFLLRLNGADFSFLPLQRGRIKVGVAGR